jgi:hypothetical protein
LIGVPQRNLHLSPQFLSEFVSATEQDAKLTGRIYGLEHLPDFLAPAVTEVPIRIPSQATVEYPSWPTILVLLFGGALIASLVLGGKLAVDALHRTRVRAENEAGECLPADIRQQQVYVRQQLAGSLNASSFYPGAGVRLDPEAESATIATPVLCVLKDGSRVRLLFGGRNVGPRHLRIVATTGQHAPVSLKKR